MTESPPPSSVPERPAPSGEPPQRNRLTALLLCIFLGWLGIHRFYTGYVVIGVIQLLTGGGCGIWALIDLILIAVGSYRDVQGRPLAGR